MAKEIESLEAILEKHIPPGKDLKYVQKVLYGKELWYLYFVPF